MHICTGLCRRLVTTEGCDSIVLIFWLFCILVIAKDLFIICLACVACVTCVLLISVKLAAYCFKLRILSKTLCLFFRPVDLCCKPSVSTSVYCVLNGGYKVVP